MINNRQNGRRRGRGGGAPRPNGGGPDRGNRIDNRARGNAAQLHEKYKALARDAQMQGDRVNTEYYLQFADHYFRVLSENRARFEDQQQHRPRRDDWQSQGDYQDDYDDEPVAGYRDDAPDQRIDARGGDREDRGQDRQEQGYVREQREPREQRDQREPREQRNGRYEGRRPRNREQFAERVEAEAAPAPTAPLPIEQPAEAEEAGPAPRRRGRRPAAEATEPAAERLSADRLPPAFTAELPLGVEAPVEEKPKARRGRKPKADTLGAEA